MGRDGSVRAAEAQVLVAVFAHPAGSGEMSVVNSAGALRLGARVYAEQDFHGFLPVGAVCFGIEKATVELDVGAIVVSEKIAPRRFITIG